MTEDPKIKTWMHSRKGRLRGVLVETSPDGEWVDIQLTSDDGEHVDTLTVRRAFLTEVPD